MHNVIETGTNHTHTHTHLIFIITQSQVIARRFFFFLCGKIKWIQQINFLVNNWNLILFFILNYRQHASTWPECPTNSPSPNHEFPRAADRNRNHRPTIPLPLRTEFWQRQRHSRDCRRPPCVASSPQCCRNDSAIRFSFWLRDDRPWPRRAVLSNLMANSWRNRFEIRMRLMWRDRRANTYRV